MTCRWNGTENPRTITGRHSDDCAGDECRGCQPCLNPHCRVCGVAHSEGTCADCMDETREALHEIARKCGALTVEVLHRGVNGEAMMLLGPAADPEQRGHLEASVACGRVPPDYLAEAIGDDHPVWVLGTWDMVWRDALDHDTADLVTLAEAVDYLDRTMGYMSTWPHVPFEDFASALRRCLNHLDVVIHDQAFGDRANVACFDCHGRLERKLTEQGFEDVWTCGGCRRRYTYAEYNFALRAKLEEAPA